MNGFSSVRVVRAGMLDRDPTCTQCIDLLTAIVDLHGAHPDIQPDMLATMEYTSTLVGALVAAGVGSGHLGAWRS